MSAEEVKKFQETLDRIESDLKEMRFIMVGGIDPQTRQWVPGLAQNQLENMITLHGDKETGRTALLKRMGDAEATLEEYRNEKKNARERQQVTWKWVMAWATGGSAIVELVSFIARKLFHQ